jgi:predicted nucleic acid-binding protein
VKWLKSIPPDNIAIPFSAIFEIAYGIRNLLPNAVAKALQYEGWLEQLLAYDFLIPASNAAVAKNLAAIASTPQLKHFWISGPERLDTKPRKLKFGSDPLIAATAIAHAIPIVSSNVRDFELIDRFVPLPGLYNPLADEWIIDPPEDWEFPMTFGRSKKQMAANCR